MERKTALKLVKDELSRASKQHGAFNSAHEGYAVLLEEVEELWAEVKANNGDTHRGVSEAVQVAAMALRFLIDITPEESATAHTAKAVRGVPDTSSYGGYSG